MAKCPELFIEPGLQLIRRQIIINGRRPDVLFSDSLSRHLLVEIQRGRLDESHLQRHFYYFYDYRSKYPERHTRLLFIANRIVPQHKEFLDDHGYEFREYPEGEFERRARDCDAGLHFDEQLRFEATETPGVLPLSSHSIVYQIDSEPMTLCYKMLLLMEMAELADSYGRVPLSKLAERFKVFFTDRLQQGKAEENPNIVTNGALSRRSLIEWQRIIREQPVRRTRTTLLTDDDDSIRWSDSVWQQWNPALKEQIKVTAWDRLVRYFERHVPGGF